MSNNKLIKYHDRNMLFQFDENGYVNLALLGKKFGYAKRPANWMQRKLTKRIINAISIDTKIELDQLIISRKGNPYIGTWAHPTIAFEYAKWLDPLFSVWVNGCITELLDNGYAVLENQSHIINEVKGP